MSSCQWWLVGGNPGARPADLTTLKKMAQARRVRGCAVQSARDEERERKWKEKMERREMQRRAREHGIGLPMAMPWLFGVGPEYGSTRFKEKAIDGAGANHAAAALTTTAVTLTSARAARIETENGAAVEADNGKEARRAGGAVLPANPQPQHDPPAAPQAALMSGGNGPGKEARDTPPPPTRPPPPPPEPAPGSDGAVVVTVAAASPSGRDVSVPALPLPLPPPLAAAAPAAAVPFAFPIPMPPRHYHYHPVYAPYDYPYDHPSHAYYRRYGDCPPAGYGYGYDRDPRVGYMGPGVW
ncbi:MAG: hypothetical protein M1818_005258 [Claussenomyces sp. TS43310]|nr:MAG: hypothetical protein M1818_005258 [Claussenomyces sp. TS43310]